MALDKAVDEVLEFIWTERERGESSVDKLFGIEEVAESGADLGTLKRMEKDGLVWVKGDTVVLTMEGEKFAAASVRRHRLAERLLTEVLSMDPDKIEKNACSFEHTLSPEVVESICTLLGHPPTCPHGLAVPKGDCCLKASADMKPLVQPLSEAEIGETCRIVFIASSSHGRLDRLSALGIVPGSEVRVHQRRPAFVIELGETTLALDPDIIGEIYVKRGR